MPLTAGPPLFTRPSNVYLRATGTSMGIEFDTDQAIQLSMVWQRTDPGADPGVAPVGGTVTDAAAATHHLLVTPASLAPGQLILMTVQVAATDSTGLTFRPMVAQQRTINTRMPAPVAGRSVPVRWNTFGDGTRPAGGGGIGNWSSYTWAQYNPKGTTYPTP